MFKNSGYVRGTIIPDSATVLTFIAIWRLLFRPRIRSFRQARPRSWSTDSCPFLRKPYDGSVRNRTTLGLPSGSAPT